MARCVVKQAASDDLREILDFLEANAGPRTALKYAQLFDASLERISKYPETGAPRPKLGPQTRIVVVSPYVDFYDYDSTAADAVVLRILHSRRNTSEALLKRQR